jgi:threonine dehydrogenase-like Zn-dependent dehydrogenase
MRGVVLPGLRRVEFREFPVPHPGPGQVLVRMRASGLCGSDLRVIYRPAEQGSGPEAYRGVIAGHEPAGDIVAVGDNVTDWHVGDRVALYHIAGCGECDDCRSGWMVSCTRPRRAAYGWQRDGGHADYLLAETSTLVRLPEWLTYSDGALVACGFGTAYAACLRAGIADGMRVLVTGLGPVGLAVAVIAGALGAGVTGVEPNEDRAAIARSLGINAMNALEPPEHDALSPASRMFDAAVDCSAAEPARLLTLAATRRWGTVVWVGEGGHVCFEPSPLLLHQQLTLRGSWVCSVQQMSELMDRLVTWRVHPDETVTHRYALADCADAYRVFDGGSTGKVVIEWTD